MDLDYYLTLSSTVSLRMIDGIPNSIWTYTLMWADQATRRRPIDPGPRLALTFSSRIRIRDPKELPDVPDIQDTQLQKPDTGDVQYVFRDVQERVGNTLVFCFVAPSEIDSFTAVRLAQQSPLSAAWTDLPFKVSLEGDNDVSALQQVMSGPAIACPSVIACPPEKQPPATVPNGKPAGNAAAVPLDVSAREILKGTLVPLKLASSGENTHGLAKYGLVRQLGLTQGETDSIHEHLEMAGRQVSTSTLELFRSFEQAIVPALRPEISAVAAVPSGELAAFADALVQVRTLKVQAAQQNEIAPMNIGTMMHSLNSAVVASRGYAINTAAQPIGMLNLERIEMVPAGIQRGELVATIPLAPGEETAVTHKEWSVTSKEFTTIVTDSLEETSETGVTDNTDLSQSTASQTQHSTQFNITGTVQGGIPMINGSSIAGVTAQDADSQSATDSIKHATNITQKASARSRQEHKTTISTTTVTGSSEASTRVMKNTSATDPIRIDYFSLMRKWRVRLYRFGLRLTYDMVVPEPGAAMRRAYMELENLRSQQVPFMFQVKYSDVTQVDVERDAIPPATGKVKKKQYEWLADDFGVSVKPFPDSPAPLFPSVRGPGNRDWNFLDLQFNVPAGQMISDVRVSTLIGKNDRNPHFKILGAKVEAGWLGQFPELGLLEAPVIAPDGTPFMKGATGEQKVSFWLWYSDQVWIGLKVFLVNTSEIIEQWRAEVWNDLYNAEQTRYFGKQQKISEQIAAIEARISNVDTLTLRREESDEVMKSILKFVIGPEFNLMPADVEAVFVAQKTDLTHGIGFDTQTLGGLNASQWSVLRQHEELVRFINQAIEWENVVTFLYSYFWDVPQSWAFIRGLRHPDATRQAFLRAGSARVVLTVRKGWEAKWVRFVQDLTIDADVAKPTTDPYLSIAQEIAAYDDRNYPGIPPANPARAAVRLQDAVYTTSSAKIDPSPNPVTIAVASSAGFVVGLRVILDVEDDRHIQEAVVITEVPPDVDNIIVVAEVAYAHDGTQQPFPVLQPGDKGALIAEWNEYTPSSGIDIAVTSNLATIA